MVHIIESCIYVLLLIPQACQNCGLGGQANLSNVWILKMPVPPIVPKFLQSITNATHTTHAINKQLQHMTKRAHLPRHPCYLDYEGCSQLYRILPSTDYTQDRSQTADLLEPEWIRYQFEFLNSCLVLDKNCHILDEN